MSQTEPEKPPTLPTREWIAVSVILTFMLGLIALVAVSKEEVFPEALLTPHYCVNQEVEVSIEGAVAHPGVYLLPRGALVQDLLSKAEPLPDSDVSRLKIKSKLRQGQTVRVPQRAMLTIELKGAVKEAGTIRIPKGARLCDLLDKTEFAEGANLKPLKKKRRLKEGEVIIVSLQD